MCYVGKATKIFIFIVTVLVVIGLILGFGLFNHKPHNRCSGDICHSSTPHFPNPNPTTLTTPYPPTPIFTPNPYPPPDPALYPPPDPTPNPVLPPPLPPPEALTPPVPEASAPPAPAVVVPPVIAPPGPDAGSTTPGPVQA